MLIEDYITYISVQKRYSELTQRAYRDALSEFVLFASDSQKVSDSELIDFLTPLMIRGFIAKGLDSGLSSRSINQKLSALSSFCNFLIKRDIIDTNPVKKVHRPKEDKKLPQFFTVEGLENYFSQNRDKENFSDYRNWVIVMLLYSSGLRRAELAGLKISNFDSSRSTIRVVGKGDKLREIPLPSLICEELLLYLERFKSEFPDNPDGFLFLTDKGNKLYLQFVDNVVKKELSSVEGLTARKSPHTLRHSLATHLLNNGADLNSIKEILGHSSLAATQVYTHNSFEQLKNTYLTAHPRAKNGGKNGN